MPVRTTIVECTVSMVLDVTLTVVVRSANVKSHLHHPQPVSPLDAGCFVSTAGRRMRPLGVTSAAVPIHLLRATSSLQHPVQVSSATDSANSDLKLIPMAATFVSSYFNILTNVLKSKKDFQWKANRTLSNRFHGRGREIPSEPV